MQGDAFQGDFLAPNVAPPFVNINDDYKIYHANDVQLRQQIVRHLNALAAAINSLGIFVQILIEDSANPTHTGEVTGAEILTVDKTAISNRTSTVPAVGDFALSSDASNSNALVKTPLQNIGGMFRPAMMKYDGFTGYYIKSGIATTGNKVTVTLTFAGLPSTGASSKGIMLIYGGASNRARIQIIAMDSDHATVAIRSCIRIAVINSAGTIVCRLTTNTGYLDGKRHTIFASFDGDVGASTFIIDGVSGDQNPTDKVAATAATLETSAASGAVTVGSFNTTLFWGGTIGFTGYRETYLTNWTAFMEADGTPKPIDEATWSEWGAQPVFWNQHGQLKNNLGSMGHMVRIGNVTVTNEAYNLNTGVFDNSPFIGVGLVTVASGFGTSPLLSLLNAPNVFALTIGSSTTGVKTGVLNMPEAALGWVAFCQDVTTPDTYVVAQTGGTPTTIALRNYSRVTGLTIDFVAGSVIRIMTFAY